MTTSAECPECQAPGGEEGFEVVEITTDVDRQYGVTRWKLRCWNCGYHHAFIATSEVTLAFPSRDRATSPGGSFLLTGDDPDYLCVGHVR